MTVLRLESDTDVGAMIEAAAGAACRELDSLFPGHDSGGITSNFQGLLVEVLGHMLKGRSVLDGKRGSATALPTLVLDSNFFGCSMLRGEMFLVTRPADNAAHTSGAKPGGLTRDVVAMGPDAMMFQPLSEIGDAWTSFEGASEAAFAYLRAEGLSIEEASALGLQVQPVLFDHSREAGFLLANPNLQVAA